MITFKNALNLMSLLSALMLAAAIPAALAAPVGPLTTFTAGTPAKASDVNGNFSTIVTTVNANDTRLTTVETNKQNAVTGNCAAGTAIRAIAANGTVTCQSAGGSIGITSVSSVVGVPIASTTPTNISFGSSWGRYQTSGSSDYVVVPLVLPHGATITSVSFSCIRNNAATCQAYFARDDGNYLVQNLAIPAQAAAIQTATTTTIVNPVVDNQNFSYWVFMSVNGTATTGIVPIRASVTYTLP
jgi:hypothetical protein